MARRNTKISTAGKPWARYLRLSKAEAQEVTGLTKDERLALTNRKLDDHLEQITEWMDAHGLPHDDDLVFRDPGLSAWKPNVRRPQWEAMLERAHAGEIAGIAVTAVDRYTRQVTIGEDLIALAEKVDVKIGGGRAGILDLTTYEGITQLRGMVQQAANESLATSFRLRERLEAKARKGKPMGGGRSYGFQVVSDKYVIEVPQVPEEVAVIREVASRLLAGEPLQHLAADMNERGLRTVRGGEWDGKNLGRMLGQHRYGGLVELHGEIVGTMPGEPILDRDTYDEVQALLASRRRGRRPTGRFLLTGLLVCSDCQRTMNGATRSRPLADGTKPREYRCPPQQGGCGRLIQALPTEEIVGEHMIDLLADPAHAARIEEKRQRLDDARQVLKAKEKALVDRQDELTAKWLRGELRDDVYDKNLAYVNVQLAKLAGDREAKPVGGRSAARKRRGGSPARAELAQARQQWDEATEDEKRVLIRDYQVRIVILGKQPGTQRFDRNRVTFPPSTT